MSIRVVVGTILLSTATISLACSHSPTAPSVVGCSTDTLRGSYGSQRNGQTAPGTAFTAVGLATFDGVGHLTEQMTVSTNGVFSTTSQSGGYTMGSDCTGTLTDTNGNTVSNLTMVHGNDQVIGMSLAPGSSVALHFERIDGVCSNATLKGVYGFQRNGQANGAPLLALGTITFDGKGNAQGGQTIDRGGVVGAPGTFTGYTYVVNPDCTGMQLDPSGGIISPLAVVHGGDEALGMSMTPGNNVVVHYERTR
jgi:hypothetical protein